MFCQRTLHQKLKKKITIKRLKRSKTLKTNSTHFRGTLLSIKLSYSIKSYVSANALKVNQLWHIRNIARCEDRYIFILYRVKDYVHLYSFDFIIENQVTLDKALTLMTLGLSKEVFSGKGGGGGQVDPLFIFQEELI